MLASDTDRIMYNVYEGLAKCGADGNIKPGLAESWTFDGNTFVFKIRQGVKFHDGQDLTPEDVI
ncbi:MAG: ABC transporter substrate-binding protein, partial [Firmicutes bacterium]|nr:ABC transporter substrate-binding protein [Bacillota bacterium]